jgi:CDP-6-deoxy-D-xylo-4-hexulose-3-dehydrase
MKISYGKNVYGNEEIKAVVKQLKKTTQMGSSVLKFEKKISNHFSKKYGLMVNSGSSAIMLAIKVLGLKKGDQVIVPCLNFGTAVSSLMHYEISPVFVDVEIENLQIKIDEIEKKINKKTKALMVPNLIGNIPDWRKIYNIAKKYNLKIIEDSADTLGAKIFNKSTGSYSDISITSFYGSHVISCGGNGGMLLTNNKKYYDEAKVLRSWGRMSTLIKDSENIKKRLDIKLKGVEYDKKFVFSEAGYNFEPSEIGAAFGLIQLKKFKKFSEQRNKNFFYHKKFFEKLANYFLTPKILNGVYTNFLAYPIILKKNTKMKRKQFQIFLEKNNIQTRPIFSGNILRHPAFRQLSSKTNRISSFINSDYIMKHGLLIGCHQGLNKKNINYIHKIILKYLNKRKAK